MTSSDCNLLEDEAIPLGNHGGHNKVVFPTVFPQKKKITNLLKKLGSMMNI